MESKTPNGIPAAFWMELAYIFVKSQGRWRRVGQAEKHLDERVPLDFFSLGQLDRFVLPPKNSSTFFTLNIQNSWTITKIFGIAFA